MRYFKIVTFTRDGKYISMSARGEYCKTYRPNRWAVTDRKLKRMGYGLCVFALPNSCSNDDKVLNKLGFWTRTFDGDLLNRQIWEVEVEGSIKLPELSLRCPYLNRDIKDINDPKTLAHYGVDRYWPYRTAMFERIKLVRRIKRKSIYD